MKKEIQMGVAVVCTTAALCASAAVSVENVTMAQAADTHEVTVAYTLSEPAIVTLAIETNTLAQGAGEWVRLGGEKVTHVRGDVNRLVTTAGAKTISWLPQKSWPGHVVNEGKVRAVVRAYPLDAPPDYFALDLGTLRDISFYADAASVPGGVTNRLYKTDMLLMRKIPAANVIWRMSSPGDEPRRSKYKEVARQVTFSSDYYIGVYELTQYQYGLLAVSGSEVYPAAAFSGASYPDAELRPAESFNAEVVLELGSADVNVPNYAYNWRCLFNKLNVNCTMMPHFRIPTEAQWEFACRAGTGGCYYRGSNAGEALDEIAWHAGNWQNDPMSVACGNINQTHAVGQLKPNAFGLYDMLGNVSEWVSDFFWTNNYWWNEDANVLGSVMVDPPTGITANVATAYHVLKGGNYASDRSANISELRSASYTGIKSYTMTPMYGCRLSCSAVFVNPSAQ